MKAAGIDFRVVITNADESYNVNDLPNIICENIAKNKALSAKSFAEKDEYILAADTSVVINGKILGKPANALNAKEMLLSLSGKSHLVYTGIAVIHNDKIVTAHESTEVQFEDITESLIDRYIKTGTPFDKAGAYGIQGYGQALVKNINGDYFNVMGLPLNLLFHVLENDFQVEPLSWLE